jgi:dynein heavy chain
MDQISVLRSSWRKLVNHAEVVTDGLMKVQVGFKKSLLNKIRDFVVNVKEFRSDWIAKGPGVPGTPPNIAVERLRAFKSEYELRDRKYQLYHSGEELFALSHTEYPELHKTKSEIDLMDTLYGLYVEVHEYLDIEWPHLPWEDVFQEMPSIRERMDQFMARLARMPRSLRQWDAFRTLKGKLEDFQTNIPLLEQLSKDSIKPRHWTELMRFTSTDFRIDSGDFRLQTLLDCHLEEYADDVVELCDGADKQQQIAIRILDIRERWAAQDFEFADWKERKVPVLRACGPIIEDLEESQLQCQTMLTMRHVLPFKPEVAALLARLSDTAETLERWLKVQMLWCSLESVFMGGDIAKQMPVEAKKFLKIDKDWAKVMARASDAALVVECCENELLKNNLPVMYSELEMCQKALDGYLEQKRSMFPRFYFVSNPVLLQMLSQGSDPQMIQPFYQTVFDAIDKVVHSPQNVRDITGMISLFKGTTEEIPFLKAVRAQGNIEEWLSKILTAQRHAMKDICRTCADEALDGLMEDEGTGLLRPFVDSMPPQYALLGIQLLWTASAEEAFASLRASRANKNAVADCMHRNADILKELSSWCLEELPSRLVRTKYETLITIQVHQRDVMGDLVRMHKDKRLGVGSGAGGVEADTDFEWQKQARFYWKLDDEDSVDEDGAMCVQCTDVQFNYMYEYLGCKGRLVITPLTDRCYVSLSQAMGMCYGGAPAGPAGTGKTETVKDMGRALGIYVIVTNCTDQATYQSMAKIDKGLCMSGLWGCFDEFNRIKLPVLSVVAQQILAILEAKRTGSRKLAFPGDAAGSQVNFDDACGFFITMNPGYAGRQELPENLKALFRGVTMMVPDRMIIIRVMLCAQGYGEFTVLSRKFTVLYQLCEEQLSKQRHYDFGLRNILSVLRTAGATKRENLDEDESKLLYQTLRDMNLSKLVSSDVPLFLSLLGDLFPDVKEPKPKVYAKVEEAIRAEVRQLHLQLHPSWVKKVVQLYETTEVRHGIMVIGPTGGGKSAILRTLRGALARSTGVSHRIARMNPKAILASQMYGEVDQMSDEWTTGVFAAMWTKYNQRENPYNTWILCDGPVDAIWIEDLNTVLDDNRILTLANGDRIPMTDNVKIMFENETLLNASPATVSRCGIIYVSASDLGWTPLVNSWVAQLGGNKSSSDGDDIGSKDIGSVGGGHSVDPLGQEKETIRKCFFKYMGDDETTSNPGKMLSYLRRETAPVISLTPAGSVAACMRVIDGMLNDYHRTGNGNRDQILPARTLERMFLHALTWTVGGALEGDDRRKFDEYLRAQENSPTITLGTSGGIGGDENEDEDEEFIMPGKNDQEQDLTLYDFFVDVTSGDWVRWMAPEWNYPALSGEDSDDEDSNGADMPRMSQPMLRFSSLLVPTADSERALSIMGLLQRPESQKGKRPYPIMLTGQSGTAKTSTALMWAQNKIDQSHMGFKFINFSSATTAYNFQTSIEESLVKRGGKNFGPENGKSLTVFVDDISLPETNEWGDQPTNEIVRQLIEFGCFAFLDKDKRGDMMVCEDIILMSAMSHPGGGRSDVPDRLKRHFMVLNLVPPSIESINDIYGQILRGRFRHHLAGKGEGSVVSKLTAATIDLWKLTRSKLKSTPAKFHYNFTMRDLSRIFHGIVRVDDDAMLNSDEALALDPRRAMLRAGVMLVRALRHECERVFCDKLTNIADKDWYLEAFQRVAVEHFGPEVANPAGDPDNYFVDFMQEDELDEDGLVVTKAPQVYELGGDLETMRERCIAYMEAHNTEFPTSKLGLVLFDDALRHLMRISRIIMTPRGSALLVGVGGSGKGSLTRLATFMAGHRLFSIRLTKSYSLANFGDDLKECFFHAGSATNQIVLMLADTQIKYETFLEYLNSLLLTGDVPGLFSKEEIALAMAECQDDFEKEKAAAGDTSPSTPEELRRYLVDKVRDRLHVVLCFSPADAKFATRARRFPGIYSSCSIDWFLPWPRDALVAVASALVGDQMESIECTQEEKASLLEHMGEVHMLAVDTCAEYARKTRRMRVYQTPKSYLSFLSDYKSMYSLKLDELKTKAANVELGLERLETAGEDVTKMSKVLEVEREKLQRATEETNTMLGSLEVSSLEAKNESDMVRGIKEGCEADAARIQREKELCLEDLAKAQPYVDDANSAIDSIKSSDISEVKVLKKPSDIIRLVFDCVLLLFHNPMVKVEMATLSVKKEEIQFVTPSWQHALPMMSDTQFLRHLQWFGKGSEARPIAGKDLMNAETIELLEVYMNLENFNSKVAKNASGAAEGLCKFVTAMKFYFQASKLIKPKLEALTVAEAQLREAENDLANAMKRLDKCNAHLAGLKEQFEGQMAEKTRVEEGARALERRMDMASQLIEGLAGERVRWTEDSKSFDETMRRLIGDCAVACAFVSYGGALNQEYRIAMVNERFRSDLEKRAIPVTPGPFDLVNFLTDSGTVGEWNLQGLPTDLLSTQNGILVTRTSNGGSRYPLLVDPQAQAIAWIRNLETLQERLPDWKESHITSPRLKDHLEFCMGEGKAMIIVGVEADNVDPMLDPVLLKEVVRRGRSLQIVVADQGMDYDPAFSLYLVCRVPDPSFSPELQAKTTVVDFAVTARGLEDQLLGTVIHVEQRALQDQLQDVLTECNANTKTLQSLDALLLERLSSGSGNLLDDAELISVLRNTQQKAADVKKALQTAVETRESINEKREQFRPVAARGSIIYFSIIDVSRINVMYQTSLKQFLELFLKSMQKAEPARLASKRVTNIMDTLTFSVYRYINRGLYEEHKLLFVFILATRILVAAKKISQGDVDLFLRGGAALSMDSPGVRRKPFPWLSDEAWLNVSELSNKHGFFRTMQEDLMRNESQWCPWYEHNTPERAQVPDYEVRLVEDDDMGPWYRLMIVRTFRNDRTLLAIKEFVRAMKTQLGPKYVEPVTDKLEDIYDEMKNSVPVIFLLSAGADPTDSIIHLCRKRKCELVATISMGEGQEKPAMTAINMAASNGGWVLLQNCELGLELMDKMEDVLIRFRDGDPERFDASFRLFITATPHQDFPLGLLQMCTKVTNEPPSGMRAGLMRSYSTIIDQDRLERIDGNLWKRLLFTMCFLHSIVQERRKFGSLGWSIPYEFNTGDITACLTFLEKHLFAGNGISWSTVQYMVSAIQYGGKVTDDIDRRLFDVYAARWLCPAIESSSFSFNPSVLIGQIEGNFNYKIPSAHDHADYSRFCASFPEVDSPEISGLHPNADLTFRVKEATQMMRTLANNSSSSGNGGTSDGEGNGEDGGSGKTPNDLVHDMATNMLTAVPEDYNKDRTDAKISALGGMVVPLNIFLFQEINVLQAIIELVRRTLNHVKLAIDGEVVMTEELAETTNNIFNAKVPQRWMYDATNNEYSWINSTMGLWMSNFVDRDTQIRTWLNNERPSHFAFKGFFNPQGFLTAMKQEVTRKNNGWALDDVIYHTEVTEYEKIESVSKGPREGIYASGLFVDGAAWSKAANSIIESEPKKLFASLPVLYVTGTTKQLRREHIKSGAYGPNGPYECPLYKYPCRTDRYFISMVSLASRALSAGASGPGSHAREAAKSDHWILRGVALTCSTDYE